MAPVAGKKGTVDFGGHVATINEWSLDQSNNDLDVTSFTTSAPQWKKWAAGLSEWSISFSGPFDGASTGQNDLIVAALAQSTGTLIVELDQIDGGKFSGGGYINSLSPAAGIDDLSTVGFGWRGSDTLAYSTTT